MPLCAIILDFDGVVLRSVEAKTEAFQTLFADETPEHRQAIADLHRRWGGISRWRKFDAIHADILQRPLDPAQRQELGRRFEALVVEKVLGAPPMPGAEDFIRAWSRRLPLFIASGTPQDELRQIIEKRGYTPYFAGVYGSPAEKIAIIGDILARMGWPPERVLFVGDAHTDQQAAAATGLPFIAVAGHEDFSTDTRVVGDLAELDYLLSFGHLNGH